MTAIETIASKFRSGNSVPVERATVTAEEWAKVAALIEAQAREIERMRDALCKIDLAAGVFRDDVSYLQTAAKKALEPPQ